MVAGASTRGEMARRTYRRRSPRYATSFASSSGPTHVAWPSVRHSRIAPYESVLDPQVSASCGQCSPADIGSILHVTSAPAIRRGLSALDRTSAPDAPRPPLSGEFPPRPDLPILNLPIPPEPPVEPRLDDFRAAPTEDTALRRFSRAVFGEPGPSFEEQRRYAAAMATFTQAWRRYESNHRNYELNHKRALMAGEDSHRHALAAQIAYDVRRTALNAALAEAKAEDARDRKAIASTVARVAATLERLLDDAAENRPGGVEALAVALWRAIPLPADFPRRCEAQFEPASGVLLLTVDAPDFERVALTTPLKSSARKPVGDRARRLAQQSVNHILPLRIAHEVYASPEMAAVQLVGVNVCLAYIDRRNGQSRHEIVASMTATREEFEPLNISEVDPKKCFRSLRGVETTSYDEIASVKPLLQFDTDDRRIVEGRDVVDSLDASTNLAAMDWEDFEHVVRELFAKMFSARSAGAEVHVTRASRDYGVDALVYDPDPIMGGKYVIQAKRYVNTVEVSAVRDLFGTVQNEGASKGFLVTTSAFGPDAHQFAKGKPLTLIDGSQLLGLLDQHGNQFRIDLREARRILHGT